MLVVACLLIFSRIALPIGGSQTALLFCSLLSVYVAGAYHPTTKRPSCVCRLNRPLKQHIIRKTK